MKINFHDLPKQVLVNLERWRQESSRQAIGLAVIEQLENDGLWAELDRFNIPKPATGSLCDDATLFAQNLWRWAGAYPETKCSCEKLFVLKDSIIRAAPESIRAEFLTDCIGREKISCAVPEAGTSTNILACLKTFSRQVDDVQKAMLDLEIDGATPDEIIIAKKRAAELQAVANDIVATVNSVEPNA